ncbi:MAG: LacI family DNA-binding transcriptional regulator [Propionicimonas sp.]|nr:LacI family DNA-binding transcriptional regulator [Propionicimonas sp.]
MSDVARVANVSATTVSHVINKTRKVNPATEKAVRDAIDATGYAADTIARSLRTGRSHTIGLAMTAISNTYFGDVVHSLEREATSRGYTLILTDTHDEPQRELRAIRHLLSHRVDGLVLAPSAGPAQAYAQVLRRKIPLVLIDRVPSEVLPRVDAVGVHNVEPIASLVDHLVVAHGHTRIGMLAPKTGIFTTQERIAGFHLGLERNGLDPGDAPLEHAGEDADQTSAALERILDRPSPPTALVLGNNLITVSTIAGLRRRGITPPHGIATVSFDDFPWADSFQPRLTTISQPVDELGAVAARLLLERMEDPGQASRYVRLTPTFQLRESCGCPPAA